MVERIVNLIKEKGLSLNAVEKELGFGNGAIKRFGTNSPSIDKIMALSEFLDVSIDYLVYGERTETQTNILTENEEEMLGIFKKLTYRGQLKLIGKAEDILEREVPNQEKNVGQLISQI